MRPESASPSRRECAGPARSGRSRADLLCDLRLCSRADRVLARLQRARSCRLDARGGSSARPPAVRALGPPVRARTLGRYRIPGGALASGRGRARGCGHLRAGARASGPARRRARRGQPARRGGLVFGFSWGLAFQSVRPEVYALHAATALGAAALVVRADAARAPAGGAGPALAAAALLAGLGLANHHLLALAGLAPLGLFVLA